MPERPFIVVNPAAANGSVGRNWAKLQQSLEAVIGPFDHAFTESAAHTAEVTRKALRDGYRDIASMGGDGTHSLVVNGFFDHGEPVAPDASLSILAAGTGGDFKRLIDAGGRDLGAFARHLRDGQGRPVDVGHIRYTQADGQPAECHFINIASFGIPGEVDRIVNRSSKALGGRATFFLGGVRALMSYEPPRVTIVLDDEPVWAGTLFLAAACNGQYFGGGMHVAPDADLSDGLLDLIIMPYRTRLRHALTGTAIYKGKHLKQPGVVALRGKVIRAEADGPCPLDIDGEAPGGLPAEIRVIPGGIRLKGLPEPQSRE